MTLLTIASFKLLHRNPVTSEENDADDAANVSNVHRVICATATRCWRHGFVSWCVSLEHPDEFSVIRSKSRSWCTLHTPLVLIDRAQDNQNKIIIMMYETVVHWIIWFWYTWHWIKCVQNQGYTFVQGFCTYTWAYRMLFVFVVQCPKQCLFYRSFYVTYEHCTSTYHTSKLRARAGQAVLNQVKWRAELNIDVTWRHVKQIIFS